MMKSTELHLEHEKLGAKLIDFHGWNMPLQYSGILAEHNNVRQNLGLFDISHMGKLAVSGADANEFLNFAFTNDVNNLAAKQAHYSLLLNGKGGIIDDAVIQKIAENNFIVVLNASNFEADKAHLVLLAKEYSVVLDDLSASHCLIALQGQKSVLLLEQLLKTELKQLKYYHFTKCDTSFGELLISRLGYTGEDGFEIMVETTQAVNLWRKLLEQGAAYNILPIGLGARDTLRLEAGYFLHGNDITPQTNPRSANLMWAVKMKKPDFVGKAEIPNADELTYRLYCLQTTERAVLRPGQIVKDSLNQDIGVITSGTMSPLLKVGIAICRLDRPSFELDIGVNISLNNRLVEAKVVKSPFVKIEKPYLVL